MLQGRRVALLERRHGGELAALVLNLGGVPVAAPAVDEIACHDDFNAFFDGVAQRRFSIAVFMSGTGTRQLLAEADRRGRLAGTLAGLGQTVIAARGRKPVGVLRHYGLKTHVTTASPHTSTELMHALSCIDVRDRGVVLVHHGERNFAITDDLRGRGARLTEIAPYQWALPEDVGPITSVVRDLIACQLDAVVFTNEIQCRHIFEIAADMGRAESLVRSLNQHVIVGAVGPVCAQALRNAGVTPHVVPSRPNMRALVEALAEYFQSNASRS